MQLFNRKYKNFKGRIDMKSLEILGCEMFESFGIIKSEIIDNGEPTLVITYKDKNTNEIREIAVAMIEVSLIILNHYSK